MTKAVLIILLVSAICSFGATGYVDDITPKYISTWTGIATQPNYEWRMADGLDYDTTGSAGFDNYGSTALATALTIGNAPLLTEGFLAPHQTALDFDGINDYLLVNNSSLLQPDLSDFAIMALVRTTSTATTPILEKWNSSGNNREYLFGIDIEGLAGNPGSLFMMVTEDGSGTAGHRKSKTSNVACNDGEWHLVGVNFVSDVITLSQDGATPATTTVTNDAGVTSVFKGNTTPRVAYDYQDGGYADIDIAWLAYWVGAGTPSVAEMTAIYNAMTPLGTTASPYASIQSGIYQLAAGDTILINAGTYQETVTLTKAFDYVGATSTTTFPVIYGTDLPSTAGTNKYGMTLSADNEVGFLTFRGFSASARIGLYADGTSDGSLIHHCEFDSNLTAVNFNAASDNDSLINCTIDGAALGSSTGILKDGAAGTVVVTNCIIYNAATGINESTGTINGGYNDLYANTTAYSSMSALTGDQTRPPRFLGSNDYRLSHVDRLLELGALVHIGAAPFAPVGLTSIGAYDWAFVNAALAGGGGWGGRSAWGSGSWGRTGSWGR